MSLLSVVSKQAQRPFLAVAHSSLLVQQQRTNTREAIHKYVEPNKYKKHMLAACEPYIRRKYLTPEESCKGNAAKVIEMHPLDRILVKELVEDIKQGEVVLFIQYNYTPFQSDRVYRNTITKSGGKFQFLNNEIYKEAFRILDMEYTHHLILGKGALITGKLDCLVRCVNAMKKMPQYLLLAGLVNNHMYNVDQLKKISTTTSLDETRANLLNTLTTPASELSSYLESHRDNISGGESVPPPTS